MPATSLTAASAVGNGEDAEPSGMLARSGRAVARRATAGCGVTARLAEWTRVSSGDDALGLLSRWSASPIRRCIVELRPAAVTRNHCLVPHTPCC